MTKAEFSYIIECDADLWNAFYKERIAEAVSARKIGFILVSAIFTIVFVSLVLIDQRHITTYLAICGGFIGFVGLLCLALPYKYKPARSNRPVQIQFTPDKVVVDGSVFSWTFFGARLEKAEFNRDTKNLIFTVSYPGKRPNRRPEEKYSFPVPPDKFELAEKIVQDYRQAWSLK